MSTLVVQINPAKHPSGLPPQANRFESQGCYMPDILDIFGNWVSSCGSGVYDPLSSFCSIIE